MRVLLDTNALLMPGQFGIDIFTALYDLVGSMEPCVLPGIRAELRGIARGKGKDAAAARLGLAFCARCTLLAESEGSVDDQLVRHAAMEGCAVVTNDRALRNRLLCEGVRVITLRREKALTMIRR